MMSFNWKNQKKPIVGLSAMDGVTDASMRHVSAKIGAPDLVMTEFTSAEGLTHNASRLLRDFYYTPIQRPILAQVFGATPEAFRKCATLICSLGFDGMDINMGCPSSSVVHRGGGAALIKTPKLAQEIIRAAQQGIIDWVNGKNIEDLELSASFIQQMDLLFPLHHQQERCSIPLSVKTRIGYDSIVTTEWISQLLETSIENITIHGRTLVQQYSGEANWDEIAKAAVLIHQTQTTVLGNGDITMVQDVCRRIYESNVDGVLIGRAAMGNPWFFKQYREYHSTHNIPLPVSIQEREEAALLHIQCFEDLNNSVFKNDPYPFLNMRKHLGWYVKDYPNAAHIRQQLFQTNSYEDVRSVFEKFR